MGRTTGFLTKSLEATTAVPKMTLVKYGAADGTCVPAVDGSKHICGVSANVDTAVGERVSCFKVGNIADVIYGGNVTRGDPLTSDANGRAVLAAPAAGANVFCFGFAEVSGVLGDIGSAEVAPFILQGA